MKYIYAIKYKGKTRYRVVVCTQGRRKIHLGYADSIEKAKEIRNKFFGITNDLIKRRLNLIIFAINHATTYDFELNEKDFQSLKTIKSAIEKMINNY